MFRKIKDEILRRRDTVKYWRNKGAQIGDNCDINCSASLGSEPYLVKIGNHVRLSSGVKINTHDGSMWVLKTYIQSKKSIESIGLYKRVIIGNNVHIGIAAIIMPRVKIGDNCIIGVGAIVTHDVPNNTIVAGVPARIIETVDEYIDKHKNDFDFTKHNNAETKRQYLIKHYLD